MIDYVDLVPITTKHFCFVMYDNNKKLTFINHMNNTLEELDWQGIPILKGLM